jgi:hypothetical protein
VATALKRGWLTEPRPGVLALAGSPSTWEHRLMVLLLAGNGHAVASHRAAARLHELDGFDHAGMAAVEATVTRSYRLDVPGTVSHHVTPLDEVDITTVKGFACTTVVRTLADLGAVVHNRRLVGRALTSARRNGVPVESVRATVERVHRPGPTGTAMMLRLLDAIPFEGRVPDTWFEELLARCIDDPSLPPVVPQCPIVDADGRIVACADIGIPSVKLGLEAHSREFHWGPIKGPLDEERDIAAAACGWELLYLGWHATKKPAEVLKIVRAVVETRKCELSRRTSASTTHSGNGTPGGGRDP